MFRPIDIACFEVGARKPEKIRSPLEVRLTQVHVSLLIAAIGASRDASETDFHVVISVAQTAHETAAEVGRLRLVDLEIVVYLAALILLSARLEEL